MGQMDSGKTRKVLGDRDVSADFNVGRLGRIGMSSILFPCRAPHRPMSPSPLLWAVPVSGAGQVAWDVSTLTLPLGPASLWSHAIHLHVFVCPWLALDNRGSNSPQVSVCKQDRQLADLGFDGEGIARDGSCCMSMWPATNPSVRLLVIGGHA